MKQLLYILIASVAWQAFGDPPPPPEGFMWEVNPQFTDEFNGTALDASKWHDHHPRWKGRAPAKFVPENVSVKDGLLHLTNGMLAEEDGPFTIGGAAVVSKKTEAYFGYYECRLKASNISMSSTFWMSNPGKFYPDIGKVSQELDILETVGGSKRNDKFARYMNSNTHVWHNGSSTHRGNKAELPTKSDEDFYVYAAWWENANTVHFYLNDQHVGTVDIDTSLIPHPFEHPMHINMVTETYDWESPPTPEEVNDTSRNTTLIDWVRSYALVPSDGSLADWQLKRLYEQPREWKAANGKSSTKATLIKSKHGYAYLKKKGGKEVRIPAKLLSQEDRDLLARVERSL